MQSYFIWNNVDCRSMGITLASETPIVRGEEAVQHIVIPGRAGDLTLLEGSGIYHSYIQTVNMSVKGAARIHEVLKWLSGSGEVTFSGEPERKQSARVIGAVTLSRISRNMDRWSGEVQFYCQPYKSRLTEDVVTITSATTLVNDGDITEFPIIKATFTAGATVTITSSSGTFTIDMSPYSTTHAVINCQSQEATTVSNSRLLTGRTTGDFPRIDPGSVEIGGSGWSSLEITRARRYL